MGLLALGNVVNALTENKAHIPYRDSKLTRMLQVVPLQSLPATLCYHACTQQMSMRLNKSMPNNPWILIYTCLTPTLLDSTSLVTLSRVLLGHQAVFDGVAILLRDSTELQLSIALWQLFCCTMDLDPWWIVGFGDG